VLHHFRAYLRRNLNDVIAHFRLHQ
jgi:hypothetical protein